MNATDKIKVNLCALQEYRHHLSDGSTFTAKDGATVVAIAEDGRRWVHSHRFADVASAWHFIRHITSQGGSIHPSRFCWTEADIMDYVPEADRSGSLQQYAQTTEVVT